MAGADAPLAKGVTLFRPIGQAALDLIRDSGRRAFPPRLPEQPAFYPEYASQIARDWNSKDTNHRFLGYVVRFEVERAFLEAYGVHRVGGRAHDEYWIPAEDLEAFNAHIIGLIEVVAKFERREEVTLAGE